MTLSLPGNNAPSGNINLLSISSKNVVIVELYVFVKPRKRSSEFHETNLLPKRCTQEITVHPDTGNKRYKKNFVNVIYLVHSYTENLDTSSINRKIHTFLIPCSQEMTSPKNRIFITAKLTGKLSCNE